MKTIKRYLALVVIVNTMVLSACGKSGATQPGSGSSDTSDHAEEEIRDEENASLDDQIDYSKSPFVITVTDEDKIYIEIKKEIYDPSKVDYAYFAEFYDEAGEKKLAMDITGGDFSQARLMYGEPGDTKTTAVSDYDPEDKGDSYLYTIILNDPSRIISGGDNLSIPVTLFEDLKTCNYETDPMNYVYETIDAATCIRIEVDHALLEAKERGREKIEELLYQSDDDIKYLTPTCEDYRVDIFETKAIIYDSCSIASNAGIWVFGTDPMGTHTLRPCTVYRLYEYDYLGQLVSYKEKTVFESESDALHVSATLGRNGNHALYFIDWLGENKVPENFTDEQGLKAICDEFLPAYYEIDGQDHGYQSSIVRIDNIFYFSFFLNDAGHINKEFFSGIGEMELLGDFLGADGVEFSADNTDDEGFIYMESGEDRATIYYSKPEAHRHNISTSPGENGGYPDDFVEMPYDEQYFAPVGDDFILWYSMYEDYGDYDFNSDAVLISFDRAGNITDARYRLFRPSNMTNPMSELVDYMMNGEGVKLLYQDDTYAYFDIADCVELKEYIGDGVYGERFNKAKLLEMSVDEETLWMPMKGWSSDNGMYVSK